MSYSAETLWLIAIAGLVVGAGLGLLLSVWLRDQGAQSKRQLERQLDELRSQQHDYQQEVSHHFNKTAQLLGQLTSSYRDVHNHLAQGAERLTGSEGPALQQFPEDSPQLALTREEAQDSEQVEPPRDYAPRQDQRKRTLDEDYGLDEEAETDTANTPEHPRH